MADLRFCAYQYQHLPLEVLHERWRVAEDLGFDVLWNCDTVVEPDHRQHTMFDGLTTLTLFAIAAKFGDAWRSLGGYDVETEEDFFSVTAERSHRFDDLCAAAGRDPTTIRHSLVCFPPLTPWQSPEYFRDMVGRFSEIGTDEFVLYWPQMWREAPHAQAVFEEVRSTVMAQLRASRNDAGRRAP